MSLRRLAVALVVGSALLAVPVADATVPPRNCGPLKVGTRNYIIKADQIRCSTAKSSARAYLTSHRRPSGYSCRNYTNTAMTFRCSRGVRVFFAIRR